MHARAVGWVAVATMLAIAASDSEAAIYRCRDAAGNVLYVDTACTGGTVVDVVESRPDPAAIERLRRDAAAFEARQALRDTAAREFARERAQREAESQRRAEALAAQQEALAYAPAYAYAPWPVVKPPRAKHPLPRRPSTPTAFIRIR